MATKKAVVHPIDPFLFDGPSFQNFVFHLKSSIATAAGSLRSAGRR
jgi:hypothetical protein